MRYRVLILAVLAGTAVWLMAGIGASRHAAAEATPVQSRDALVAALRQHVKHVFVIYQENHSFDNYFGTYPGAENLSTALARAHGFRQYDSIGKQWVTPFRIADPEDRKST